MKTTLTVIDERRFVGTVVPLGPTFHMRWTYRHVPAVEINGATLAALQVLDDPDGWRARCVVNV